MKRKNSMIIFVKKFIKKLSDSFKDALLDELEAMDAYYRQFA